MRKLECLFDAAGLLDDSEIKASFDEFVYELFAIWVEKKIFSIIMEK